MEEVNKAIGWHCGRMISASKSFYRQTKPDGNPIFNANTPAGIAQRLFEFIDDVDMGRKIGIEGRSWYLKHVQNALDKYEKYFNSII